MSAVEQASSDVIQHPVRLVAASGKEQPVLLCIRKDGLWLYTQGGKVILQLYHHGWPSRQNVLSKTSTATAVLQQQGFTRQFADRLQEIQQLPYQHIVKWLPSKLRSKDPGSDDCLDVQVETTAGKKDLRMRCADVPTVQRVITDIRITVQVISDSTAFVSTVALPCCMPKYSYIAHDHNCYYVF